MNYRCKHFDLPELVPPDVYSARGEAAWELLDARALAMLDALRGKFGPAMVNNWSAGGPLKESGLRVFGTRIGARYSQHLYGRANDCKFRSATPQEVYRYVLDNQAEFPGITTVENIEDTPTWFHFDVRNHQQAGGIWVVRP